MSGVKRGIWLFFACAICLAVLKSIPHDSQGLLQWADKKAQQSEKIIGEVGKEVESRTKNIPQPKSIIPKETSEQKAQAKKAKKSKKTNSGKPEASASASPPPSSGS